MLFKQIIYKLWSKRMSFYEAERARLQHKEAQAGTGGS